MKPVWIQAAEVPAIEALKEACAYGLVESRGRRWLRTDPFSSLTLTQSDYAVIPPLDWERLEFREDRWCWPREHWDDVEVRREQVEAWQRSERAKAAPSGRPRGSETYGHLFPEMQQLQEKNGKLTADDVRRIGKRHGFENMENNAINAAKLAFKRSR